MSNDQMLYQGTALGMIGGGGVLYGLGGSSIEAGLAVWPPDTQLCFPVPQIFNDPNPAALALLQDKIEMLEHKLEKLTARLEPVSADEAQLDAIEDRIDQVRRALG